MYEALNAMTEQIAFVAEGVCESPIKKSLKSPQDAAATKIQSQARVWLNKLRFRQCLYKMILFKNIVETKVHKEKMQMLFAFEQLIINTEAEDTQD